MMRTARRLLAAGAAATLGLATFGAAGAAAHGSGSTGDRSIATVLLSDGNTFDRNWHDYDILTEAALAVLEAKPNSPVAVLTQGGTPLTVFAPNDRAFRLLAGDLTHKRYTSEKAVFTALAGKLGIDTIESVLLYHVVPGATITAKQAKASDGAKLAMASGGTVTVDVLGRSGKIALRDADRNDRDPRVVSADINKGNKQIAHGISRVLRPADL